MKKFQIVSILLTISILASAQDVLSFRGGATTMLYDHRYYPELFGPSSPMFPSASLKLGWEDYSSSPYASLLKHPEYGLAFSYDGIGLAPAANGPGVGSVYSLYGYFDRPFIKAGDFSLGYTTGFGFGFVLNKFYDPVTNPWNEIFSYPLNAHISLGLQAKYNVTDKYYTGLGLYFNHTSNGSLNWYNRGYNGFELALNVGMRNFKESRPAASSRKPAATLDDGFKRGFQFDIHASGGVMISEAQFEYTLEHDGVGVNQRYFKYAFQGDILYKYARTHASGIGLDLFVTPFCDVIAKYDGKGNTYSPVSFGISVLHEFCYRDLTATVGVGKYLHDNDGIARNKKLYQLVNIRYHFPQYNDIYLGIVLKAHKFMAAECVQYCIGKRF